MANNMNKMLAMLIVCILVVTPMTTEAALSCSSVISSVTPCLNYLTGQGVLTSRCCGGIRSLNGQARTTPDRQSACACLKGAAGRIPGIKSNLVLGLPSACGVSIPYTLSPSTDCSKVK